MSRVVVVLPLVPLTVGESFAVAAWPLHVTVVPPFDTDATPAELGEMLADAADGLTELIVVAAGNDLFGRRHTIPVTLIADDDRLTALRNRLVAAARESATSPEDPALSRPDFRPHVTVKGENRVHEGDRLRLTSIALVDMAPRNSPGGRTVLATIPLACADRAAGPPSTATFGR